MIARLTFAVVFALSSSAFADGPYFYAPCAVCDDAKPQASTDAKTDAELGSLMQESNRKAAAPPQHRHANAPATIVPPDIPTTLDVLNQGRELREVNRRLDAIETELQSR